ncbi:SulP family inorganic anion transporter [Thauera aminoaromatica]|uniref:Sulfate transporter n=1 Tax=Thauera aminoaromatica S2 TaxID=1234381 RepID=N6YM12_THASP|nr:SulP family inorganic anion transporter [Thauera aminoaromatica]ENO83377.1 sulfate transporter [Thauera aminoaromatica S2]
MPSPHPHLPFLAWPAQWREHGLRGDLVAGITVALVLIPQALAYAKLAGLPPHIGLYAALLPAVVAALFGSCGQLSTGPVALTSLLVGASILPLGATAGGDLVGLALLLALLSGLIQLALGALRLGWLLNLLSVPVLMGFVNAAALIICLTQIPPLLGLAMPHSDHLLVDFVRALGGLDALQPAAAAFGVGSLAVLVGLKRLWPRLPGVPLVVAATIALSAWTGFAAQGGAVVGAVPAGLPGFSLPPLRPELIAALLPAAFVVAMVSFMEAASSAKLICGRTRQPWNQDQELVGQGLGKLAAAFTGGLPVSASFSRSALNYANEARTGLSSLVTAAFVLAALLWFTPLLWHLPKPVLAAIILQAVAGLIDTGVMRRAWRASRDDGAAAAVTFLATLAFAPNIQNGVFTGLILSLALLVYRGMRPRVALLGLHEDGTYRDRERFGLPHPHPRLVILRFDGPLSFVTAATFEDAMLGAARAQESVRVVLVSAAGINAIDATGLHTLASLVERFHGQGQTIAFCGLKKQVIDAMERDGVWARIGAHSNYRTEHQALDALQPALAAAGPAASAPAP